MVNEDYEIDVTPSVDTPDRSITLTSEGITEDYPVTAIGRVAPGDDLTVEVTAPSTEDYQIQLRDQDGDIWRKSEPDSGDINVTFDTGQTSTHAALDPKSYGAAAIDSGHVEHIHPVVVTGYTVDVEAPRVAEANTDFEVSATVSPIASLDSVPAIQEVELAVWNADTTDRTLMDPGGEDSYHATASEPAGDYSAAVVVKSTEQFGDNYEPVGFSDPTPVSVKDPGNLQSPAWSVATDGRMQFSAPAVTSSRVFHGGLGARLDARDRTADGARIWSLDRAGALSDGSPVLHDGTLYVGSGGGVLYALDASASSTSVVWKCALGSAITSTPVVADGTVFVGTNDGRVHAVDTGASGSRTPRWSESVGGPVYSALDASTDRVFVTTADGDVLGLRHDGSIDWTHSTAVDLGAAPPVYDGGGTVYVAADRFLALNATDGSVSWSLSDYDGTAASTPVVDGDAVYVGDASGTVFALDSGSADPATPTWTFEVGGGVAARPAVVDTTIVVAALDGTVFFLDAANLGGWLDSAIQDAPVRSPLVASDGDVFVGTEGGMLAAYANVDSM